MKLKLKNNTNLSTVNASNNFKSKCEGFYIVGCDKMNAKTLLESILQYQDSNLEERVFKNIRMHLPYNQQTSTRECSSSYDELNGYTTLSGYNSDGDPQKKPVFGGTWHITDFVSTDEIAELETKLDMQFLTLSAENEFDWSDVAVQTLDPTKIESYNPAVAIILNNNGIGNVITRTSRWNGNYILFKDESANVKKIDDWFSSVTSITDDDKIVTNYSGAAPSYNLTSFNSLSSFTSLSSLDSSAFMNDTYLESISLPDTLTKIGTKVFYGCTNVNMESLPDSIETIPPSAFEGCGSLSLESLPNSLKEIDENAFKGCEKLDISNLPLDLRYVSTMAFSGCSSISISEIPSSVTYIGKNAFDYCDGIESLHINRAKSKVTVLSGAFDNTSYPIYIGNGDSSYIDNKILNQCIHDNYWNPYSERLSSWYKKEYFNRINPSNYEIIDYVQSDGLHNLSTGKTYSGKTAFSTDIGFFASPSNSSDSIHGSNSFGIVGSLSEGVTAKVSNHTHVFETSATFTKSGVHSYCVDLKSSKLKYDGVYVYNGGLETVGDDSPITFFGSGNDNFIGVSWMNRCYTNSIVTADFVPSYNITNGMVGFYDVVNSNFIGEGTYSSEKYRIGLKCTINNEDFNIITEDGTFSIVF